jgi:meso-butanediol dehydrogenase/(S,S)-butanediol dehydrogenase/diacetyl reductase
MDGDRMDARFQGRVVVVIDRGSGMGAAAARQFAAEGASVVIAGATREVLDQAEAFDPALDSIGDTMGRVASWQTEVGEASTITGLLDDVVSRHGRLDVLVNAGGLPLGGRVETTTPQLWREILSAQLDAIFYASCAAIGHLRRTAGTIVNVVSARGVGGEGRSVGSTAAHAGALNLTRAMAIDHGPEGVRVNAVCPILPDEQQGNGTAATAGYPAADRAAGDDTGSRAARAAHPSEVADVIVFLASQDARFVNGVSVPVDGGFVDTA